MKETTNALTVAGAIVESTQAQVNEVMRSLGRHDALQFIRNASSAAAAKQYATLKANDAHLLLGRKSWDEFCRLDIGMDRKTVDGYIAALAEYGEKYFATAKLIRVPVDSYRLIEGHIDDATGEIEIDGERLAFTKQNAPRIKAFIEAQKRDLGDSKEDASRAKRAASEAKKKLSELKARDSKLFADATPAQLLIFRAESDFMRCIAQLEAALQHEEFDLDSDAATLQAMCEFIWNRTAKVGNFDGPMRLVAEAMNDTLVTELAKGGKLKEFRKPQ